MRYLGGFVFVVALVASPVSVSAQAGEDDPLSEEPAPSSQPAPEDPALQLKLDDAGVGITPTPPRTPDGYTLEEMELRVKRARIGLFTSTGVVGAGLVLATMGIFGGDCYSFTNPKNAWCDPLAYTGAALVGGGIIAVIATGVLLANRSGERAKLQEAQYERPHRVQWDLARSRLVF